MFGGREIAALLDMIPTWKSTHRHILVFKSLRKVHDELGDLYYPWFGFFSLGFGRERTKIPTTDFVKLWLEMFKLFLWGLFCLGMACD